MITRMQYLAVSIAMGLIAGPICAQQREPIVMSGEGVKSRYVQQHAIDVDDVPGHQIRVQESQRDFPEGKQIVIRGERIVQSSIRGFSNYSNGVGPAWGYVTWTTDKGSKIFVEFTGTSESSATESGSRKGTYHGTARLVGGTGQFAKIRGTLVDSVKFDTDPKNGYNSSDSRGEYWFEE